MPWAAALSSSGFVPPSVPQVRIVLTPMDFTSGRYFGASAMAGPQVRPLTVYGWPPTVNCQFPCEPVTSTAPVAGGVPSVVPYTWNSQRE